jgi:hypothetical protein
VTFPAFKAGDSTLRGPNGGFDFHTPPPSFKREPGASSDWPLCAAPTACRRIHLICVQDLRIVHSDLSAIRRTDLASRPSRLSGVRRFLVERSTLSTRIAGDNFFTFVVLRDAMNPHMLALRLECRDKTNENDTAELAPGFVSPRSSGCVDRERAECAGRRHK